MTPEQLWNDRTFFTLLTDVWKARKDATLGPVRLQVLLGYIGQNVAAKSQASITEAPAPFKQQYIGPNPFEPLREDEKIKVDLEATQAEAATAIEAMVSKIKKVGESAQGQFQVRFTADEGQAVQEIEHYLEHLKVPYRLASDRFGNQKTFDPQSRSWILNFVRV